VPLLVSHVPCPHTGLHNRCSQALPAYPGRQLQTPAAVSQVPWAQGGLHGRWSQAAPANPDAHTHTPVLASHVPWTQLPHVHVKPLTPSMHMPPLAQGSGVQLSTLCSQFTPSKPRTQLQR
jgi:hypothetical protein